MLSVGYLVLYFNAIDEAAEAAWLPIAEVHVNSPPSFAPMPAQRKPSLQISLAESEASGVFSPMSSDKAGLADTEVTPANSPTKEPSSDAFQIPRKRERLWVRRALMKFTTWSEKKSPRLDKDEEAFITSTLKATDCGTWLGDTPQAPSLAEKRVGRMASLKAKIKSTFSRKKCRIKKQKVVVCDPKGEEPPAKNAAKLGDEMKSLFAKMDDKVEEIKEDAASDTNKWDSQSHTSVQLQIEWNYPKL